MTRFPQSPSFPAFFVSADWSKDARKRSVHVADLSGRRIWREERDDWNLTRLLKLSIGLAERGSVLVGIDAALGVAAGYWGAVRARLGNRGAGQPNFIDWLSGLGSCSGFFEPVSNPDAWRVDRPFFRVGKGKGGRTGFTGRYKDGFLRRIDCATGAKPVFAVSGMPGTVGWGTIALWKELIPLLAGKRDFAVWPFEGELPELLSRRRIVLAETYPGLAYAAALANTLPASQLKVAKTKPDPREHVCELLQTTPWVRRLGVDLGDLEPVRKDEDAFDSHLTAAAVLRCGLEGRALCDHEWIERQAAGAMLLAGPVDPLQRARTLPALRPAVVKFSSKVGEAARSTIGDGQAVSVPSRACTPFSVPAESNRAGRARRIPLPDTRLLKGLHRYAGRLGRPCCVKANAPLLASRRHRS